MRRLLVLLVGMAVVAVLASLAGCGASPRTTTPASTPITQPTQPTQPTPSLTPTVTARTPTATPTRTPTPKPSPAPALGTVAPAWLGTRVLPHNPGGFGAIEPTPPELRNRRFTLPDSVPELPGTGFASQIRTVPAEVLARSTWVRGCPVTPQDLRWVLLSFHGFDGKRHTGELLTNKSAAGPLVQVFGDLWKADFPIEEMRITTRAEQTAPPTGDGNDTGSFNCRPVVGSTVTSQHAYGLAIDINPFQNPYEKGDLVLPELASAYKDRSWTRPGMILAGGPVTAAFARIGWGWGGAWHSLKDIQHFSANGR